MLKNTLIAVISALFALTPGSLRASDHASGPSGSAAGTIDRFAVERRISPAFGGRTFGNAGVYEVIIGRIFASLDPEARINRAIAEIDKAPRSALGRVEYSTQVTILRPVDPSRASGNLVYEVINRSLGGIDPRDCRLIRPGCSTY